MEELRKIIALAVEEGVRKALENANFATTEKDPDELLTIKQVHKEFNIGTRMVQKMFNDPELAVQRYTRPFRVSRKALKEYMNTSHNYLCEGGELDD